MNSAIEVTEPTIEEWQERIPGLEGCPGIHNLTIPLIERQIAYLRARQSANDAPRLTPGSVVFVPDNNGPYFTHPDGSMRHRLLDSPHPGYHRMLIGDLTPPAPTPEPEKKLGDSFRDRRRRLQSRPATEVEDLLLSTGEALCDAIDAIDAMNNAEATNG